MLALMRGYAPINRTPSSQGARAVGPDARWTRSGGSSAACEGWARRKSL